MQIRVIIVASITLIVFSLAAFLGCGRRPVVCNILLPIDIEEVKSDTRDLEQELTVVRERLEKAQDDLAAWEARMALRKSELPLLEAELARAKKASGVTEEMVVDIQPKPQQAQEIKLMPRGE